MLLHLLPAFVSETDFLMPTGVLGLDNFNDYYPVALKRARQAKALAEDVHVVDGDLNDGPLLRRLFRLCDFTHVLHLAAQVGHHGLPVGYRQHNL